MKVMKSIYSFLVVAGLFLSSSISVAKEAAQQNIQGCESAKEYITTLEYIRAHQEFALKEDEARKVADQVSKGCSGSAQRFVRVVNLLSKASLSSKDAFELGKRFALLDDEKAEAFIVIFREGYAQEYLDLDIRSAMDVALLLSETFDGRSMDAQKDFQKIVSFCVEKKGLDLPKQKCSTIAARVAAKSAKFGTSIAPSFLELFHFLKSSDGPGISTVSALQLAEDLIQYGPLAAKNYQRAFTYASSEGGLKMPAKDSMSFAHQITSRSFKTLAEEPVQD